jgi:hypothetical protein
MAASLLGDADSVSEERAQLALVVAYGIINIEEALAMNGAFSDSTATPLALAARLALGKFDGKSK